MNYLLDTNVISEARRRAGNPGLKAWLAGQRSSDLAISVVTVLEIETGVMLRERDDPTQGRLLRRWFMDKVLTGFADRILPLDLDAARRTAALHVPDKAPQHDALIAGTALSRGLTVVTRNTADFERTGAAVLNPWS